MATLDSLMEEKSKILSKIDVQQYVIEMFKDSGIKALIVGEFIPLMNQKINEYLEKFDLFVDFSLDSEFNETIKSRHRDAFSYNSFSEGEKQRIDLAILFAWRSIAMERNSAATNIIIFDETLDQSLDADAVDGFTEILEDIGNDIHVFVVSHKDMVPEVFDRWIKVEKKNDFAVLTET
jgi:DNA repair exonuclease SbcCD ATPase subunit